MKKNQLLIINCVIFFLLNCSLGFGQSQWELEKQYQYQIDKHESLATFGDTVTWSNRTILNVNIDSLQNLLPQYSKNKKLVDIIIDGAYQGKIKAYETWTAKLLSKEEVKAIQNYTDTVEVEIPKTKKLKKQAVKHTLDRKEIKNFRVMMDWFYNSTTKKIKTKVVGIAPVLNLYTDSGSFKGTRPLFWIYFD